MATNPKISTEIWSVTKASILAVVGIVGTLIVLTSIAYFPPNFQFGFLQGRESYFYSWYSAAFYTHVIASPLALFVGGVQSVNWLRIRYQRLHQRLGYVYVVTVLGFTAPSGLAMAIKANGGALAITGFATLACATWFTTWQGVAFARAGKLSKHRRWMTRSYLLICSAVVLRFIAALTNRFHLGISYDVMAWLSFVPSLVIYESAIASRQPKEQKTTQ